MSRIDLYAPHRMRVWVRLSLRNDSPDLTLLRAATDAHGEEPEWWYQETQDVDLEDVLCIGSDHWPTDERRGWYCRRPNTSWALQEGIAPGQPFCMEVEPPHWYRCSYEYNEWDVSYDAWPVEVEPWPLERVAKSWERFNAWAARWDYRARNEAWLAEVRRKSDTDTMYLSRDWYFAPRQPYYDEMCAPKGLIWQLCSGTPNWGILADGRSDQGEEKEAQEALWKEVAKRLPHLDLDLVKKLPVRR